MESLVSEGWWLWFVYVCGVWMDKEDGREWHGSVCRIGSTVQVLAEGEMGESGFRFAGGLV